MEELALDPNTRNATRNIPGGGHRDAKTVEVGYMRKGLIVPHEMHGQKSYGIREEHRVTWTVFQVLRDRLGNEGTQQSTTLLDECPSYAWSTKMEVFIDFLWRSVDKFATGFEIAKARAREDFTIWEQTKLIADILTLPKIYLRWLSTGARGRTLL